MIADPETFSFTFDADALLHDFLSCEGSLLELADKHRVSIIDLLTWYEDDATQELLNMIEAMAARRMKLRATDYAPLALNHLADTLADPAIDAIERRRAAALILRRVPTRIEATKPTEADRKSFGAAARAQSTDDANSRSPGRRAEPREPISHSAHDRPPRRDRQSPQPETQSPEVQATPNPNPPADAG